nr:hypothetical protein [Streptomyces californicus]
MLVERALADAAPQVAEVAREGLLQDVGGASAAGVGGPDSVSMCIRDSC